MSPDREVDRLRATLSFIEQLARREDQPWYDERPVVPTGYRTIASVARLALLWDPGARRAVAGEWVYWPRREAP